MNEGVQLILKRMDSHPEEFADTEVRNSPTHQRWYAIMSQVRDRVEHPERGNNYMPYLASEEIQAIYDKWKSIQGPAFTDAVMRIILLEDAGEEYGQHYYPSNMGTATTRSIL